MNVFSILFLINLSNLLLNFVNTNICDEWSQKHIFNSTELHMFNSTFPFVKIDAMKDLNLNVSCRKIDWSKQLGLKVYANKDNVLFESDFNIKNVLRFFSKKQAIIFQNIQ